MYATSTQENRRSGRSELFRKCIGSDDVRAKTGAIGGNTMTEKHSAAADSGEKPAESRSPRSIRFSDFEWACIEQEAAERGMTAAELVRHAAVGFATGKLTASSSAFPPGIAAQFERIYRGVYLLSTLKRDEMVREGRREELDRIGKDARESQAAILKGVSE